MGDLQVTMQLLPTKLKISAVSSLKNGGHTEDVAVSGGIYRSFVQISDCIESNHLLKKANNHIDIHRANEANVRAEHVCKIKQAHVDLKQCK